MALLTWPDMSAGAPSILRSVSIWSVCWSSIRLTFCPFQSRSIRRTGKQASKQPRSTQRAPDTMASSGWSYRENNRDTKANGRTDDFAVAGILLSPYQHERRQYKKEAFYLVGSTLEADKGNRQTVHLSLEKSVEVYERLKAGG